MFCRMVGKLKASQNDGTHKRLEREERERLAQIEAEKERLEELAKESLLRLKTDGSKESDIVLT